MKKIRLITICFSLALAAIVLQSSSGGRATIGGEGNTDAPGDASLKCYNCHSSNNKTVDLTISVLDGNETEIQSYVPGEKYDVVVTVVENEPDLVKYGFQMIGLLAPLQQEGDAIDNWTEESEDLKVVSLNNGRQYVEHGQPSENNQMVASFTAPETGTGPISIYACGNAVNGANGSSGDQAACVEIEIAEDTGVNTRDLTEELNLSISPNPTTDILRVSYTNLSSGLLEFTLLDASGKRLRSQTAHDINGTTTFEWHVSNLPAGLYYLETASDQAIGHEPVLIQ